MTTQYILGFSAASAEAFSAAHYSAPVSGVTQFCYGWIKHPESDDYAIVVKSGQESFLTGAEQAELVSYATLDAAGWFVVGDE